MTIVGGETATLPDIINGFDLAERVLDGEERRDNHSERIEAGMPSWITF